MTPKQLYNPIENIHLEIKLPASKSISNRALILDALAYSPYEIENLAICDDTTVLVEALDSNSTTFDIGAAGTSMRFLTAFLSKTVGEWIITGSERMKQRPIKLLVDALNQLGARIEYIENEGFPPLRIFGSALMGGEIKLKGNVSSQYISALMMIAPNMQNGLKITLEGKIISKPYIQGRALTVKVSNGDNLFVHKAIGLLAPNDILVIDGGGDISRALVGELMATRAHAHGAVAFVVDGAIRDVEFFLEKYISSFRISRSRSMVILNNTLLFFQKRKRHELILTI